MYPDFVVFASYSDDCSHGGCAYGRFPTQRHTAPGPGNGHTTAHGPAFPDNYPPHKHPAATNNAG